MESDFKRDPWVKVGTTTIDGTLVDIVNVLDVSSWPIDWARDAKAAIDLFIRAETPWLVGGRWLVAKRSHVNAIDETAVIRCDIVRRLSECCEYCDREHLTDTQRERAGECETCSASIAAKMSSPLPAAKPTCPECGPHGNRGEVLLASSWAKCTTCAGGKPGDLWGEVKVEEPLSICGVDVNSKPTYDEVRTALATTIKGLQAYSEGERVVDRWGRTGVVVPADESWPKSVRVRMDAGWTGIFSLREIAGKADL